MKSRIDHFIYFFTISLSLIVLSSDHNFAQLKASRIEKLTESSEIIVIGKVVKSRSDWNEKKDRIFTKVTIKADEYVKGNNADEDLVVTVPGGEVGDVGEIYSHMPRFSDDEEVLLFVKKDKRDNNYKIIDGEDGKISLLKEKLNGERVTSSKENVKNLKEEIKRHLSK